MAAGPSSSAPRPTPARRGALGPAGTALAIRATQGAYAAPSQPDIIGFGIGLPDPGLYPVETLDSLLEALPPGTAPLQPGAGLGGARAPASARRVAPLAGHPRDAEEILVTTGGQQGLNVVARAFLTPGDVVLTEATTYPGALLAFRWAGADVVGVPIDHDGVSVEALEEALIRYRPKLVYLIPASTTRPEWSCPPSGGVGSWSSPPGPGCPSWRATSTARCTSAAARGLEAQDAAGLVIYQGS